MNAEFVKIAAETVSLAIELFSILLIAATVVIIILNNVIHLVKKDEASFKQWKKRSWRGIQGGLDLFVAADLLSTITIDRNLESIITLGILLLIRTLISWSLELEIDGCWPWQRSALKLKESEH